LLGNTAKKSCRLGEKGASTTKGCRRGKSKETKTT